LEGIALTSPVCTRSGGEQVFWGALLLYSNSRRAGLPGRTTASGRVGAFAWMPVFSSIETTSVPFGRVEIQPADDRGFHVEVRPALAHHPLLE